MNVEEEVIFLVTSDLCSSPSQTSVDQTIDPSAIPVALISRTDDHLVQASGDPLQYEEPKEEYCIMDDDISHPKDKKSRRRGAVWNYFIPSVQDRAQCTFCSADISYKGKSTNNLLRHLRTKHSETTKSEIVESKVESCTTEDGSTYYVLSGPSEQPLSPAHSNSSFQEESESATGFKRRGGVWKFFGTDSNKRAKCKLCSTLISFKGGSTTNLLRHMKSKHVDVKVPMRLAKSDNRFKDIQPQSRSSIQHTLAEIVNECVKSDDENDYTDANRLHFDDGHDELDEVENIVTLSTINPSFSRDTESQNDTIEIVRERRKSALAWKYFTMESEERAKCNACEVFISFKGGSTGNLLRHLKTKHSEIDLKPVVKKEETEEEEPIEEISFDTIENEELAKFVQLLNPKYKLRGVPVPRLNEKEVPKRLRKRGAALSFFNISSDECGTCRLCGAAVNLKNGSKAPFLRHLKAKHPEIDTILVTSNSNGDVTIVDPGLNIENIENIPMEINDLESPAKDKITRKMRKRGLVWNHFAPLEDEKAKCIACPAVISYKRGSTSNLLRHMKKKHPEIDVHDESYLKNDECADPLSEEESDEILVDDKPRRVLRKRGRVWNHFKPVAKDRAKCGLCGSVVVYLKGSTTNLLRHVKKKHPSVDLSKEKPFNKRLSLAIPPSKEAASHSPNSTVDHVIHMDWDISDAIPLSTSATVISNAASSMATISDSNNPNGEKVNAIFRRSEIVFRQHFDKFLNRPVSVTKSKQFDEQLAKMIVKQYCPFTIVENDEFRKFVQTVNPGYSLPSRKTISSRLIPELYEKCMAKVRNHLRQVCHVTITTNGWTLTNNECYIAVTAHFIDEVDCVYQSYLLDCFRYDEQHSAETLGAAITAILADWDVAHKVNAVVSDNTPNVTAAIRLRSWRHIPCFANMLNLVVQAGLLEVHATHEKVRTVVDHVKKNSLTVRKLAATLKELELPETKLRRDDPLHWETSYDMFQRMLACRTALVNLDSYVETLPMLTEHEWLLLEKTCVSLKPFLDITNEVSEKNITISKVIPLSRCIGNYLKKMLTTDEQLPRELNLMLNQMMDEITLRFSDVEDNALLAEATFLDPRFKNQAFINEQAYANTYHSILQMASAVQVAAASGDAPNSSGGADAATTSVTGHAAQSASSALSAVALAECNIWEEFDSRVNQLTDAQNPDEAAAAEIENYLQETLLSRGADPLVWWKERKSLYPRLFDVMKQRLCIAATAISKNFTSGGQLVCEKRNKLSSSKVSMVLFLNHNL